MKINTRVVTVAMSAVLVLTPTLCKAAVAIQEVPENQGFFFDNIRPIGTARPDEGPLLAYGCKPA